MFSIGAKETAKNRPRLVFAEPGGQAAEEAAVANKCAAYSNVIFSAATIRRLELVRIKSRSGLQVGRILMFMRW